jgi:drug/metabolite transporter (DMT)-like permease
MISVAGYKNHLADVGLFYSAAIWGATFYIVKQALDGIDPVLLVGYRFSLAAVVLGILLAIFRRPLFMDFGKGAILGILLCILYITQTIGLGITTASNSGFITGTFVAFVPLFSLLIFRKKSTATGVVAAVISLTGLWLLTGRLAKINAGDLLTLVTAMVYAIHILFADRYMKGGADAYILSFQQFLVVGAISLLTALIFGLQFSFDAPKVLRVILFLSLFPTLSAFVIQVAAQRFTSPVKVSLIFAFEPVFAALFAWTLGNETVTMNKIAGGFLVFLALVIAGIRPGKDGFFKFRSA